MSREACESVLKLGFSERDKQRMDVLAKRARLGMLTDDEREEVASYEVTSSFIGLLKSKARISIKRQSRGCV